MPHTRRDTATLRPSLRLSLTKPQRSAAYCSRTVPRSRYAPPPDCPCALGICCRRRRFAGEASEAGDGVRAKNSDLFLLWHGSLSWRLFLRKKFGKLRCPLKRLSELIWILAIPAPFTEHLRAPVTDINSNELGFDWTAGTLFSHPSHAARGI